MKTPIKREMKAATVRKIRVGSFIASSMSFHRGSCGSGSTWCVWEGGRQRKGRKACVRARVRACVRVCVRACVHACVVACVFAWCAVCARLFVHANARECGQRATIRDQSLLPQGDMRVRIPLNAKR